MWANRVAMPCKTADMPSPCRALGPKRALPIVRWYREPAICRTGTELRFLLPLHLLGHYRHQRRPRALQSTVELLLRTSPVVLPSCPNENRNHLLPWPAVLLDGSQVIVRQQRVVLGLVLLRPDDLHPLCALLDAPPFCSANGLPLG